MNFSRCHVLCIQETCSNVCKFRPCLATESTNSAPMRAIVTAALQRQHSQTELIFWITLMYIYIYIYIYIYLCVCVYKYGLIYTLWLCVTLEFPVTNIASANLMGCQWPPLSLFLDYIFINPVSIVTQLWLDSRGIAVWILARKKVFFFPSPNTPYSPWGPPTLVFSVLFGCWGCFSGGLSGWVVKLAINHHLVSRLKIIRAKVHFT